MSPKATWREHCGRLRVRSIRLNTRFGIVMRFTKGWFAAVVLLVGTAMLLLALRPQPASGEETKRELPSGEMGRVIELGREVVDNTGSHPLSKQFVGNDLTCSSCHLDAGQHPEAASFLGVATAYPAWSPREQRVITLE